MSKSYLSKDEYKKCIVEKKTKLHKEIFQLRIMLGDKNLETGLKTGDYISLMIEKLGNIGITYKRFFCVSSPVDKNFIDLVIKEKFSRKSYTLDYINRLRKGDVVLVKNEGGFNYDHKKHKSFGMILGSTGISSGIQIINKKLSSEDDKTKMTVVYGAKTIEDILFKEKLDEINDDKLNNIKVKYITEKKPTEEDLNDYGIDPKTWEYNHGYVNEDFVNKTFPDKNTFILVSGPLGLIKDIKAILDKTGHKYYSYV